MGRRDRMVVGFTTTYAICAYPAHGKVYSIYHYMIKFVSDLRLVSSFLRVLQFEFVTTVSLLSVDLQASSIC
jgi:hypothetical protein